MPVLNELVSFLATDAEGFVHLDLDLELELELEMELGVEKRRRGSLAKREEWPPSNCSISCKSLPALAMRAAAASQAPSPRAAEPSPAPPPPPAPPAPPDVPLCHVRAAELFPKRGLEADDPCLAVPFQPVCGEAVQYLGRTQDGVLALSNYRLFHRTGQGAVTIFPLMLVESADVKDIFYLHIMCKDARSLRCTFASGEQCMEWSRRLETALQPPGALEGLFAFPYRAWAAEPDASHVLRRLAAPPSADPHHDFRKEVSRLQFDLHGAWRVSMANAEFRLCPSYPPLLLVPACVTDDALETVAKFRSSRRIPAVVWRHRGNGAVIARCSQPEVGWLGWRSNEDEQLLAALAAACHFDRGLTTMGATGNREPARQVLIVDARSYASAVTNRARGGGCECPQYYPCAEIQFMCLPNIHSVRKSFQALRSLAAEPPDHANWHSVLERSLWLQAVGGLLKAATLVARAVHAAARPTLVHCSDGWDRTPQIVATAQLLLDPYYRTCEGFRILVEREWLDFGHKFADRCGHTVGTEDLNERCPVFLQWLDCVHQILVQYPCSFEFSQAYLIKLAQHAYSCLFGTFLCNSRKERTSQRVAERTFSVWRFLRGPAYRNHLYEPNSEEVIYPAHSARALAVWAAVYLGAAPDTPAPHPPPAPPAHPAHPTHPAPLQPTNGVMTKTRSYGDLLSLSEHGNTTHRRSSDPSITVDAIKLSNLSIAGANGSDNPVNNDSTEQQLIDEYSDNSVDSDIMLGSQQAITNGKSPPGNSSSNYVQMQNLLNTSSEGLINTTVPKQIVNGYSKANGNIVPIQNGEGGISQSLDVSQVIDSNSNMKTDDFDLDSINQKLESNGVYENGNTPMMNEDRSLIDSPDQIDGIADNSDYVEQAIDTIADSPLQDYEERPARIVTKDSAVSFKSGSVLMGLTPTEDGPVFLEGNFSESSESGGRVRNESLTWRSISECSQQTDSSSGCVDLGAELNISANTPMDSMGMRGGVRRPRLDSVQNGGLNDTAAILLDTEIGNLISAESAANKLSEQQSLAGHRRQKSDGNTGSSHFEYFPPLVAYTATEETMSCSDMTLCPNSPLRACHRTQSAGAASNTGVWRWHGRSVSVPCAPEPGVPVPGEVAPSPCRLCTHYQQDQTCWAPNCRRMQHRQCGSNGRAETASSLDPVDGLVCPQSPVQHRLHQIIQDHKMREEVLKRELHAVRVELLQRACRTARLTPDHTEALNSPSCDSSPEVGASLDWNSLPLHSLVFEDSYYGDNHRPFDSLDSYWDYYPPSDASSVTADSSGSGAAEAPVPRAGGGSGVRWVPDHAVSRCMRCAAHFWLGKRKHHCRSCGRIFCAECSENTTPLPSEQLYSPVRICAECFASLVPNNSNQEKSMSVNEQAVSTSGVRRPLASAATSPPQTTPPDVRHLSDYCKQVGSEPNLGASSAVTAASN